MSSVHIRCVCLLLTIHISLLGISQDTTWQNASITPDVSVSLPGPVYKLDTFQMKIVSSQSNGYFFQVKYLKQKYEVGNGDELIQGYDSFLNGYLNTKDISPFTNTVSDTSFNGTMGEWIHSTYSKNNVFREMYTYVVLANSHFYIITLAGDHPITAAIDPIILRYYASLYFPNKPIKEHSGDFPLRAASYRTGQHIGQRVNIILPYFLIICIALLAIFLVYTKIIRKKKLKQHEKS